MEIRDIATRVWETALGSFPRPVTCPLAVASGDHSYWTTNPCAHTRLGRTGAVRSCGNGQMKAVIPEACLKQSWRAGPALGRQVGQAGGWLPRAEQSQGAGDSTRQRKEATLSMAQPKISAMSGGEIALPKAYLSLDDRAITKAGTGESGVR